MTNQEKKKWLLEYRRLEQNIERDMEELQRLESRAEKITSMVSDMPKGSQQGDSLQRSVEKICELKASLNQRIDAAVEKRKEIEAVIETLEDKTLQLLLRYRYIDGMTWEQIALKLNYSYMHVCRLHGQSLSQIML